MHLPPRPDWDDGFLLQSGSTPREGRTLRPLTASAYGACGQTTLGAQRHRRGMNRKLIWIEQKRFRGFGCSECAWVFNASGAPAGKTFDEMMQNFELRRDQEFTLHVCADYPKAKSTKEQEQR